MITIAFVLFFVIVVGALIWVARTSPIIQKRIRKFTRIRRGYYSFLIICSLYGVSIFSEVLINDKPLIVQYEGSYYFPNRWVFGTHFYPGTTFGLDIKGEPSYRALQKTWRAENSSNWLVMPPIPYSPVESLLELPGQPPHRPSWQHLLGTDDRARDVLARMVYGFRISISFAIVVVFFSYCIGVSIGALLGYFGGKFDLFVQRFVEIWSSLPFLYTIIIISSILKPSFWLLAILLVFFRWMGMTYYIRGEFYREKSRDYVQAAIAMGADDKTVIFRHILPNALTPVISFAPFAVVAAIGSLVSLDFLGFGLPPPTPSWGEMMSQGLANLQSWWLVMSPFMAMFATLLLISFIGEAVREAFDPKEYARLR